jgi:hypothetical protein
MIDDKYLLHKELSGNIWQLFAGGEKVAPGPLL